MSRLARVMFITFIVALLASSGFAVSFGGVEFAPRFSPVHKGVTIHKDLPADFETKHVSGYQVYYQLQHDNDPRNFGYVNYYDPAPFEKFSRSYVFNTRFGGEKNNFKRPMWVGKYNNPWSFNSPFYSNGVGMVKHDVTYTASFSRYGHYGKRLN